MTNIELGRIEQVELREVWPREAEHFTRWLVEDPNLALLGDCIQMQLAVGGTEQHVGPFRADVICVDSDTGENVLIENQIERTDHSHLGQLITYAAGLDSVSGGIGPPLTAPTVNRT